MFGEEITTSVSYKYICLYINTHTMIYEGDIVR